ncbi:hypothetical protein Cus16_3203 [Curtobacterium sp. ER1/6]|nr:hypothetical protein Cus16_3203 [Curtobacterium sp. ER1/6]
MTPSSSDTSSVTLVTQCSQVIPVTAMVSVVMVFLPVGVGPWTSR